MAQSLQRGRRILEVEVPNSVVEGRRQKYKLFPQASRRKKTI
jgi:hypothetical protein